MGLAGQGTATTGGSFVSKVPRTLGSKKRGCQICRRICSGSHRPGLESGILFHATPTIFCISVPSRNLVASEIVCPIWKIRAALPHSLPSCGIKLLTLRRPRNLGEVPLQQMACQSTADWRVGGSLQRCRRPKQQVQRHLCFPLPDWLPRVGGGIPPTSSWQRHDVSNMLVAIN